VDSLHIVQCGTGTSLHARFAQVTRPAEPSTVTVSPS
jgi:hypothetical protein